MNNRGFSHYDYYNLFKKQIKDSSNKQRMNLFPYIDIKLRVVVSIGIKVIYLPHTDGISTIELREGQIESFLYLARKHYYFNIKIVVYNKRYVF